MIVMGPRFIRKGQQRGTVLMGHYVPRVRGPSDLGVYFQAGMIAGLSTFDPGGSAEKTFNAEQGEPMFYKVDNGVPAWSVWWPTVQGGPGPSQGYSSRCDDIVALSDGGCIVAVSIQTNGSGPVNKIVEVQNADGSVATTLDVTAVDVQRLVDQSESPRNNQYLARYDSDGNMLWVRRYGGDTPFVQVGSATYQYGNYNINVDEDNGYVFLWNCWLPAEGTGTMTLRAGMGEPSPFVYTTTSQTRYAGVSLAFNLSDGTLVGGDLHRNSLSNTGFSTLLYQDGGQVRRVLAGERIDSMCMRVAQRTNPPPANTIDLSVGTPGSFSYTPEVPGTNNTTRYGRVIVYSTDATAGPAWVTEHTLQGSTDAAFLEADAFRGGVVAGDAKLYANANWRNLPATFSANLRWRNGAGTYANVLAVNAVNLGLSHDFLFSFDKDGVSNYLVRHAAVTTSGLADGAGLYVPIHLDEDRDLIVCRVRWTGLGVGTVRYGIGVTDDDVVFPATPAIGIVFVRASTLDYLGHVLFSGLYASNGFQRPTVSGDGSRFFPAIQVDASSIMDDGGPNQEPGPSVGATSTGWCRAEINLDTLEYVPGSAQVFYEPDTAGLLVNPQIFATAYR